MEDCLWTHIGALNADKSLYKVEEMQAQVSIGLNLFCDAPNHPVLPDLIAITELPSKLQAENTWEMVCNNSNSSFGYKIKQVQKGDFTVLLWNANRFAPSVIQPTTDSTRFLPFALDCLVTDRTHLCAAVHRERGQHSRTLSSLNDCIDRYPDQDHVHIFGDMNCKADLLARHFSENEYNISVDADTKTTRGGGTCDNVIWDKEMMCDATDVLISKFCKLTHYPLQSFAYMDDVL